MEYSTGFAGYNLDGELEELFIEEGEKVTFIWSTEHGFKGWFNWFEIRKNVSTLSIGDNLQVMVIAENTTFEKNQNSDNIKGKTSAFYIKEDGSVDNLTPDENSQPLVVEPKQSVAICQDFKYKGPGKYEIKTSIFDNEITIEELSLTSQNFGL